jgi:hypothetical protein
VRNYHFIFENNDGSGREQTGQIELSDDDEAFAIGEQVIREMMQDSSWHYEGCAMELYEGGRIVGRIPVENYRKPFLTWLLGVATWQRGSAAVRNCRAVFGRCFRRDDGPWMPVRGRLTKEAPVRPAVFQPN